MFGDSMIESTANRTLSKAWLTLPVSIFIHAVVIILAIVVPLMTADSNLPEIRVTNVFMVAPPPPPPPPPPPAKKKTSTSARAQAEERQVEARPIQAGRLVAPVEIPQEITREAISTFGIDGGIEGGVEGGIEGGVVGGVLGGVLEGVLDPSLAQEAVRVTSVQRPRLVKKVEPTYPQVALSARITGAVLIDATTDIYGRVRDVRVVSGHPLLNQAAMDAVRQWIYDPYIIDGIPKPVRFTVTVTFTLN